MSRALFTTLLILFVAQPALSAPAPVLPPASPSAAQQVATGTLYGRVEDEAAQSVVGAEVILDNGPLRGVSDGQGAFRIAGVPVGPHTMHIHCRGYRSATGQVKVLQGVERSVLVGLKRSGAPPVARTGVYTVNAYSYAVSGRKRWVRRIEVWEYGSGSKQWSGYWSTPLSPRSLACNGVTLGRSYRIRVIWRGRSGRDYTGTYTRTPSSEHQTVSFYNP